MTGKSIEELKPDVKNVNALRLSEMGMKPSDYFTKYAQLFRAGGGNVNEDMLSIIAGEKAKGISLAGVMGVERYGTGTATNIERYFERYLRATSQSIAILPEILQTFTGEAQRMIRVTGGKLDSEAIATSISAISKGFGLKGQPLQDIFGAMNQGLQQSTNPAIQAMQYTAMQRALGPGATLWQMQLAMENPMENLKYVTYMMDLARQTSVGGREGYARNLAQVMSVTANQAELLSKGKLTPEDIVKEHKAFRGTPVGGYEEEAKKRFGALEKLTDKLQGQFEQKGFLTSEKFFGEVNAFFGDGEIKKDIKTIKDTIVNFITQWQKNIEERQKHYVYMAEGGADSLRLLREHKYLLKQVADSTENGSVTK